MTPAPSSSGRAEPEGPALCRCCLTLVPRREREPLVELPVRLAHGTTAAACPRCDGAALELALRRP